MTDLELAARLREVAVAAQRSYRTQRGWGAIVTPPIPDRLIDEITTGLAPVLLELVDAAVAERLDGQQQGGCGHTITGPRGRVVCRLDPHPDNTLHTAGGTSWRNLPAGYRPTDLRPGKPA